MNIDWIDFLKANNAIFTQDLEIQIPQSQQIDSNFITALSHLAIIKVSGKDAALFLQGQLTCNVNDLDDSNSFFAGFCNAKGRTISTLLILKNVDSFLLILPVELVEKVVNKLRMYILRSDVLLTNVTDELCIVGVTADNHHLFSNAPEKNFSVTNNSEIIIKFPSKVNRYLIISSFSQAKSLWIQLTSDKFNSCNPNTWLYQDVSAGIPWLTENTSEEYIPQMLNLDKLGGVSLNKGCYTGQEIIARTHYLGKAKRELFLAECAKTAMPDCDTQVITGKNKQSIGKLLSFKSNGQNYRLLIVIPTINADSKNLILNNSNQDKISIIGFQ